jgi:hypothetical protein
VTTDFWWDELSSATLVALLRAHSDFTELTIWALVISRDEETSRKVINYIINEETSHANSRV